MGFEIQIKSPENIIKYDLYMVENLTFLFMKFDIYPTDFSFKKVEYVKKFYEKALEKLKMEDINYETVELYYNRYLDKMNYFSPKYQKYDEDFLLKNTKETLMVYIKLTLTTLNLCEDNDVWFCK